MLVGTEIGAALASLGALKPDVFGLNCATGPREMSEHLRHLLAALRVADLRAAQRRPAVRGRRPHALRPHARRARRLPRPLHHRARRAGRRRLLRHDARAPRRVVERVPRPHAGRSSSAASSPALSSIYCPQPFEQDTSFLIIGERTNANGSKAFRDAMLAADWDAVRRMASEQISEGAHVLDVCVDYVGRDGTRRHGRDRLAASPPRPACRWCSTPPSRR